MTSLPGTDTGGFGAGSQERRDRILGSLASKEPPSTWNAATCSWPLLKPSGKVSPDMYRVFLDRKSRRRFSSSESPWSAGDFETLAATALAKSASTKQ